MKFSILIPVFNVASFLEKCLDSIDKQKYDDFEVVLIDDGSTDVSGKICDRYVKTHNNATVIHQENQGLLATRRRLFELAKGDYCVVVDSDDFVAENMLEIINQYVDHENPDMIIISAYKYMKGKVYTHKRAAYDKVCIFQENDKVEIYEKLLKRKLSNTLWSKIVKRSIVDIDEDYSKYQDVSLGEDLLQSLPLITAAKKILYTPEKLYYYRTNLASLTQKFNLACISSLNTVNRKLDEYLPRWNCINGEQLAANRYMIDVCDIFTAAVKTCDKLLIKKVVQEFYESDYFKDKYMKAEISALNAKARLVVSGISNDNKIVLRSMAVMLLLEYYVKHILKRG